jgi:hypothetical protein
MVEFREDEGTFACPICGLPTLHAHKNAGVGIVRWYEEGHIRRFIAHAKDRGLFHGYEGFAFNSSPEGVVFDTDAVESHWYTYQAAIKDERRTGDG